MIPSHGGSEGGRCPPRNRPVGGAHPTELSGRFAREPINPPPSRSRLLALGRRGLLALGRSLRRRGRRILQLARDGLLLDRGHARRRRLAGLLVLVLGV